jgi:hypothetical protein
MMLFLEIKKINLSSDFDVRLRDELFHSFVFTFLSFRRSKLDKIRNNSVGSVTVRALKHV